MRASRPPPAKVRQRWTGHSDRWQTPAGRPLPATSCSNHLEFYSSSLRLLSPFHPPVFKSNGKSPNRQSRPISRNRREITKRPAIPFTERGLCQQSGRRVARSQPVLPKRDPVGGEAQ